MNIELEYWMKRLMDGKPLDETNHWVKEIRRAQRELRAEKREAKRLREQKRREYKQSLDDFEIESGINRLELESKEYDKIVFEQNNTIEYVNSDCNIKDCYSKTARVILRPDTKHYAELKCNLCNCHNKWLPYPDKFK